MSTIIVHKKSINYVIYFEKNYYKINTGFGYRIFEMQYFKEYLFQCLHWMSSRVVCIMRIEIKLLFHILLNKISI